MIYTCTECGITMPSPADWGVLITEGTESKKVTFCKKCAKRHLDEATLRPQNVDAEWWVVKPKFVSVAKSILRHRKEG